MTRSTAKKLEEPLDEPEIELHKRRKAASRQQRNESLAIAGRNLFDDETYSLNEEKGWNLIEEYIRYQDDTWDDPPLPMNISSISEIIKSTLEGRLRRACEQLSYLITPIGVENLRNPYLNCAIYRDAHVADECIQNRPHEQVYLSGGEIYDDPSLLRFYQNNDI
ncbi:hypothetical protein Tco_0285542 [Tanacetum coccineum]